MKNRLALAFSLCALVCAAEPGSARADAVSGTNSSTGAGTDSGCVPQSAAPASTTAVSNLTHATAPVLDDLSLPGGHILAPPKPSDDNGFSGTVYVGGMASSASGSPTVGSTHVGGSFSYSVSDTRNILPTSVDIEYAPTSAAKIDEVILQTSLSSNTHPSGVTTSPATLKTRIDPGPGHDLTTSLTFLNDSVNKDFKKGKYDFFVDGSINGLGPYAAVMQQDQSLRYGIQAADLAATAGVRMPIGGSSLILTHTEDVTAAATDGQDHFKLMSDQLHTTRFTLRRGAMSYAIENDCQKYANERSRSCDWTFQVSHQVGN